MIGGLPHYTVLAHQPSAAPVHAGEIVTTGTLTAPLPVTPGDEFTLILEGIDLSGLSLTIM